MKSSSFLQPLRRYLEKRHRRMASLSDLVRRSIYISLGLHGLFLLTASVFVVGHLFYNRETTFQGQPPSTRTYDPRQLEFKVKVAKQARSSSRPSMSPRLVSTRLNSTIALPDIKIDPKVVKTSFQPKFKEVSGTGLGVGLGTGYGVGGFGMGVSAFNFFGIRGRGDKIAILVDVSVSMVEEQAGGVAGYERVKRRIEQVVDALSDAALFNVIVFGDAASAMEKELVIASKSYKTKGKEFIRPFNTPGNWGLSNGNLKPAAIGLQPAGGTTRLDLALTAAFEQGADTILIISDGIPRVQKAYTDQDYQAYQQKRSEWTAQNQKAVQQWDAKGAGDSGGTAEKVWIPPTPARPPSKSAPKEGQAPDMGAPAQEGHWQVVSTRSGGGGRPQPPPMPDAGWWTLPDFIDHFKILHETYYLKKGKKTPVVHCIGYQINEEGGAFLKGLTRQYKGQYRRVSTVD